MLKTLPHGHGTDQADNRQNCDPGIDPIANAFEIVEDSLHDLILILGSRQLAQASCPRREPSAGGELSKRPPWEKGKWARQHGPGNWGRPASCD
jgi:hypothetical protein